MLTRRDLLSLPAALAAAAGARVLIAQGRPDRAAGSARLPESVAGLTSMRQQARPITNGERLARIDRARALMAEQKMDALVLAAGSSLTYFTNIRWGISERLSAVILPRAGEPFFVCPAFEEDRLREQIALGPFGGGRADVRPWQEDESPYRLVADGLRDRGAAAGRAGVDETTPFVWSDAIATAAPALKIVSGTPVTAGCRMIKDAHELELVQLAGAATLRVYAAVHAAIHPGMTVQEVQALIDAGYARVGFAGEASVQTGEYTALPHGSIAPQTIGAGTIVMIDDGCSVEGYQSDLTRTFVVGRPTDRMKRVFDLVRRAQGAALAAARPGVVLADIDTAARAVITAGGYGPGFRYFTHRVGHGMGMDIHEWPYLVNRNMYGWDEAPAARPGMVFSNEPGIYIKGAFGVRLEDDMYITEDGAKLMTPPSASIEHPF